MMKFLDEFNLNLVSKIVSSLTTLLVEKYNIYAPVMWMASVLRIVPE